MSSLNWYDLTYWIPGSAAWREDKLVVEARDRARRRAILAREVIRRLKDQHELAAVPSEAGVNNVLLVLQQMGRIK